MSPRERLDLGAGVHARLRSMLMVLQLASPALPVGGFAYSQGLERAIEDGLVRNEAGAQRWITDLLLLVVARHEAPLWLRCHDAWSAGDRTRFAALDAELRATRESAELRSEALQMGASMLKLLPALGIGAQMLPGAPVGYTAAFALACAALGVDREAGLAAYLWAWLENQVLVAVKTVPLGQMAGQRMLIAGQAAVAQAVETAAALGDDALGSAPVHFALASARHEAQYSRLFRS